MKEGRKKRFPKRASHIPTRVLLFSTHTTYTQTHTYTLSRASSFPPSSRLQVFQYDTIDAARRPVWLTSPKKIERHCEIQYLCNLWTTQTRSLDRDCRITPDGISPFLISKPRFSHIPPRLPTGFIHLARRCQHVTPGSYTSYSHQTNFDAPLAVASLLRRTPSESVYDPGLGGNRGVQSGVHNTPLLVDLTL